MNFRKLISLGSLIALSGYILSGPVAFLIVSIIKPQPVWESPAVFAEHYSTLQDLPYYSGFLLIGGMLMLVAGHYLICRSDKSALKFQWLVSLGTTLIFCWLIAFSDIVQTTLVHNLFL